MKRSFLFLSFFLGVSCLCRVLSQQYYDDFTDIRDGKWYTTVELGEQTWMAENLCFVSQWGSWSYKNDPALGKEYGRLYNWDTAVNVCPKGWHLPSQEEWNKLFTLLGGIDQAGRKMRHIKYRPGKKPDIIKTKIGEFAGLYGGYREPYGTYYYIGNVGFFWTSTEVDSSHAILFYLVDYTDRILEFNDEGKAVAASVRCIKNRWP